MADRAPDPPYEGTYEERETALAELFDLVRALEDWERRLQPQLAKD